MQNVLDFISAALPWISMGLLVAIFAVRGTKKENLGTEGMCFGLCFGTAIGTALGSVGIGMVIGMFLGLSIGSSISRS